MRSSLIIENDLKRYAHTLAGGVLGRREGQGAAGRHRSYEPGPKNFTPEKLAVSEPVRRTYKSWRSMMVLPRGFVKAKLGQFVTQLGTSARGVRQGRPSSPEASGRRRRLFVILNARGDS